MGLSLRVILSFILLFISEEISAAGSATDPNRVLYLMQAGHLDTALNLYRDYTQKLGRHDFGLVQQMGISLLDQGYHSSDPEIQMLTLFGCGVALDEKVLYILEEGLRSQNPQFQLVSLSFLSRYQHDSADEFLNRALTSNYLPIRLEAVYLLAEKKMPTAVPQIEALMCKVDPEYHSIFPQLFAMAGTADAMRTMRKLLVHPKENVRIATILSAAKYGRDDLLPNIRTLATHHSTAQQEVCAMAFGVMHDETSAAKLEAFANNGAPMVRLAALQALYRLGRKETRLAIEAAAKQGDLFAIYMLADMPGSEDTLATLTTSPNIQVRFNAAISLLQRHDRRCLKSIAEILIKDSRDLVISDIESHGGALSAIKVIPSAQQNLDDGSVAKELSLNMREQILRKALALPESDFLLLANAIFEAKQNDLVPVLVASLETLQSPAAIALLKTQQQRAGAPLIRNYCNLALFRLKEKGPYADNLQAWIALQHKEEIIRFRPIVPVDPKGVSVAYQLTPEETTRLLVDSLEAFAASQESRGIDVLLDAIQKGNGKNKYALAGLLMRASQ